MIRLLSKTGIYFGATHWLWTLMLKLKQNSLSVSMGKSYLGSLHDMTIQIPHYSHREHTNSILSHDIVSSHNIKMWWKVSVSIQWICYRLFQLDPLFWSWLIMTKIQCIRLCCDWVTQFIAYRSAYLTHQIWFQVISWTWIIPLVLTYM